MAKKCVYVCVAALLTALVAMCCFAPSLCVAAIPAACVLAYLLSLVAGVWVLPVSSAALTALCAIVRGADLLCFAGAAVILCLTVPRIFRKKLPLIAEIAVCAGAGIIAVCVFYGICALVCRMSIFDLIVRAYSRLDTDFIAWAQAKRSYGKLTAEYLGHAPYLSSDELYKSEVMEQYGYKIGRELEGNLLWYLTGFGAFSGGLGASGALAAARCGGENVSKDFFKDLRFGKNYLFAAVLPALVFALFYLYEPMRPVVGTVINLLVTLPCALCGITLLYHTALRFYGKGRVFAVIVFWIIMAAAAVFYEWGLLILGFLGLADCVLNVRRLLDWALYGGT